MATYTLSYTGAEVNSAIGNAKDLFSTPHTWTAEQIFTNLTIQTGGLTVAEIDTNEANIEHLRVEGGDAAASFYGPATFFNEAIIDSSASLTVQGTATFTQNITVTGDVTAGSATINGEVDISDDLIVTNGDINIDGDIASVNNIDVAYDVTVGRFIYGNIVKAKSHLDISTSGDATKYASIRYTAVAIASVPYDCLVITEGSGTISVVASGGTVPAKSVYIQFVG